MCVQTSILKNVRFLFILFYERERVPSWSREKVKILTYVCIYTSVQAFKPLKISFSLNCSAWDKPHCYILHNIIFLFRFWYEVCNSMLIGSRKEVKRRKRASSFSAKSSRTEWKKIIPCQSLFYKRAVLYKFVPWTWSPASTNHRVENKIYRVTLSETKESKPSCKEIEWYI